MRASQGESAAIIGADNDGGGHAPRRKLNDLAGHDVAFLAISIASGYIRGANRRM
jgi:hypothetical protein